MGNVNFYGSVFGQSGYDVHTRNLVNSFYKLNNLTHLSTNLPADWIRNASTAEMNMVNLPYSYNATDVVIDLPPFWDVQLSNKPRNFFGYCIWEGVNVPKFWSQTLKNPSINAIITPSKHTKRAILETIGQGYEDKVKVIPHGVNTGLFKPNTKLRPEKFTFFANKGWANGVNDRGGVQWLLKAFCEEFKPGEAELLLKINTAYCPPGWNLAVELQKLGLVPEMTQNIKFIPQNVEYWQLPELYNQAHCFVSPTMGDSFNIPCLEAMSCGLPVITTAFGGQTDYVNENNGWLIDYDLIDVTWDMMYQGNKWAKPDIQHLKSLMRIAYNNKDVIEQKGKLAQTTAQQLTWDNSARLLYNLISEHE